MVVQFQHVGKPGLSIAEFVWLGTAADHTTASMDLDAVKEALEQAGAMVFVDKLDEGIWSRLGPVRSFLDRIPNMTDPYTVSAQGDASIYACEGYHARQ